MKFSEIDKQKWDELGPYLDTCLLPITGLAGAEAPWQVTEALERLRDVMDPVEGPYKGRVVTYPAIHFIEPAEQFTGAVESLVDKLRQGGFRYVFLIAADLQALPPLPANADLIISEEMIAEGRLRRSVELTWSLEK